MPQPSWEDLDEFLDDFAVPAVISLQGGASVSLSVIFDDPAMMAHLGDAAVRDEVHPFCTCREDQVGAVRRGDSIAVTFPTGVVQYDILAAAQPDGTGMATLELARR